MLIKKSLRRVQDRMMASGCGGRFVSRFNMTVGHSWEINSERNNQLF